MEIVVCIKQVPETNEVEIDEEKGILKREGVDSKMNPFDLHALELGISLKEKLGGTVTAVTMGPPQAAAVIREAFMMGADKGILLSDRKFAGADTLATSYTLAKALHKLGRIDIIICGMQTIDGDTAQVGPGIAEMLGLPHVSYVRRAQVNESSLVVEKDMADALEMMAVKLPCLLTVTRDINQPRLPSFRRKLATSNWEITTWTAEHLASGSAGEEAYFGLDGSPTQVEKIFPPDSTQEHEIWEDAPDRLAQRVYDKLKELKLL